MSIGELLIIFIVALFVFGPTKLPMLAEHLAKLIKTVTKIKNDASLFLQNQLNEQQLKENEKKAKTADEQYKNRDTD
ncbi:sec-independent protein translocase protein TatB (plasmid) [Legionella adelaidensis]|uniref:Sec-independent protein translocase protein TatB n=1 Tax=Legionella adelaidensis TaxID=45056 RepID=A0A0W0R0N9_9GAMM|nr:twin-arginine translocase TatA/TatE family subunit [Legionella adelaidensis]KTC64632.1 TatB protein (twin arginine translocation) [Legionella adelaidensis]VEH86100.1 sec-independent protein translocase protein TatB [Legionella adelaidensis]